jgi:hypothetical protein
MSPKQTTLILVGGAALAAWFSAAMTPRRPAAPAIAVRPAPIDAEGARLAAEIARLHDRLKPETAPRDASRNPFVFKAARQRTPAAKANAAAPTDAWTVTAAAAAIESRSPRLTLAGLAEDSAEGGIVRTAIISGEGQLFLAKEGDTISVRAREGASTIEYRVSVISADGVDLTDRRDGKTRRLSLK